MDFNNFEFEILGLKRPISLTLNRPTQRFYRPRTKSEVIEGGVPVTNPNRRPTSYSAKFPTSSTMYSNVSNVSYKKPISNVNTEATQRRPESKPVSQITIGDVLLSKKPEQTQPANQTTNIYSPYPLMPTYPPMFPDYYMPQQSMYPSYFEPQANYQEQPQYLEEDVDEEDIDFKENEYNDNNLFQLIGDEYNFYQFRKTMNIPSNISKKDIYELNFFNMDLLNIFSKLKKKSLDDFIEKSEDKEKAINIWYNYYKKELRKELYKKALKELEKMKENV